MGIVVKERPRLHLDSNVVVELARGNTQAIAQIAKAHDNGCVILLSPEVVHEIRRAGQQKCKRVLSAALRYCDGVTSLQSPLLLREEAECLFRGEAMSKTPFYPIQVLRPLLDEVEVIRDLRDPFADQIARSKARDVDLLRTTATLLRQGPIDRGFEDHVIRMLVQQFPIMLGHTLGRTIDARDCLVERDGLRTCVGHLVSFLFTAANFYRAATIPRGRKGAGSLSDLRVVVEIAHSGPLLTNDRELFESGQLVIKAVSDLPLSVRLLGA